MIDTTPDPTPGNYYVSARDFGNAAMLLGPFPRHEYALACVGAAILAAAEVDQRATWWAFGTARSTSRKPGQLNDRVDIRETIRRYGDQIINARAGAAHLNAPTKREAELACDAGRVLDYQRNRRRMRGTLHAPLIVRRFGRDYLLND